MRFGWKIIYIFAKNLKHKTMRNFIAIMSFVFLVPVPLVWFKKDISQILQIFVYLTVLKILIWNWPATQDSLNIKVPTLSLSIGALPQTCFWVIAYNTEATWEQCIIIESTKETILNVPQAMDILMQVQLLTRPVYFLISIIIKKSPASIINYICNQVTSSRLKKTTLD